MESLGVVRPDFWRGRRVFLTGHTGFKGSWLGLWLVGMGAKVTGFALAPPTQPSLFELARVAEGMTSLTGDIRDAEALGKAMRDAQPELVIHMAAQSLVRASYDDPVGTYATNVMGTAHVFEAVRGCSSVRAVLSVTSDKCYENREWMWGYREHDAMGGYDPYSSSKGCAELVTSAYRRSFFNPQDYAAHKVAVASARAGNVIGGGDWAADRLVPDAMRAFLGNAALEVRNPRSIRPWQHVLEPLNGYLQLCQQLLGDQAATFAEGWNFGPHSESERPAQDLLAITQKLWGEGAIWTDVGNASQPHEAHFLRLDCTKARVALHWQPLYRLEQALALTVEWYKAYQAKADLRTLTLRQIHDLMAIVP